MDQIELAIRWMQKHASSIDFDVSVAPSAVVARNVSKLF
jgi:hypothetical protein